MKNTEWQKEDLDKLKEFYPKNGTLELSRILKRTNASISAKARKLNIRHIPSLPVDEIYIKQFENISKPEIAYLLGYFWADAHISKNNNNIIFSIAEKDGEEIRNLINNIYPFNVRIYRPSTRPNSQKTIVFYKGDPKLCNFLKLHDYHIKSSASPNKILSKIPENLHSFWWQGYFNGDGCLYLFKQNKTIHPRISFVGPENQNWDFYKFLCSKLNIRFKSIKVSNHLGSWSKIYIQNIKECFILLDYIFSKGNIGLKRKYNKYLELKNKVVIPNEKISKYTGVSKRNSERKKQWRAFFTLNGKYIHIGDFITENEAAKAYDSFLVKNKINKKLNFPLKRD